MRALSLRGGCLIYSNASKTIVGADAHIRPCLYRFVESYVYARDDEGIVPYGIELRIRHLRGDESVIPHEVDV